MAFKTGVLSKMGVGWMVFELIGFGFGLIQRRLDQKQLFPSLLE
jgi:hypothetical protein